MIESPCDDCLTCHCQTTSATRELAELRAEVERQRTMAEANFAKMQTVKIALRAVERERDEALDLAQGHKASLVEQRRAREEYERRGWEACREMAKREVRVFQDVVGWQPDESRNAMLQEIENRVAKIEP